MGSVRLYGSTSGFLELAAPAVAPDSTLTLPSTGFGKVLQVVRATDSTDRSTTSVSYVDASISVTITPTLATSSILLIWRRRLESVGTASGFTGSQSAITDSSNNVISGSGGAQFARNFAETGTKELRLTSVDIGYDSPATTSAVTYKGRFGASVSGLTAKLVNSGDATGQLFAIEVAA